ncbi:glycosyltransferase [Gemella sp.]
MKKMLICISTLGAGGAEKSLVNFVNEYKNKYNISILVFSEKNNYYARLLNDIPVDYIVKKGTPLIIEKIINKLVKYSPAKLLNKIIIRNSVFKNENFDIEFAYLEGRSTKIISGSSNKKSAKYAYIHCDFLKNWHSRNRFKNYKEEYSCYRNFNNIIAVSNEQAKSFIDRFPGLEVEVIPNFVNKEDILKKGDVYFKDITTKYFCSVGRLEEVKNFDLLIEAFHNFRKNNPEYKLYILGEGSQYSSLLTRIKKLKEEDNIRLVGFKNNPYKYIKNSVGLIQSSRSESFSYVLAEANILGIPTLSTKTQGSSYMGKYFDVIEVDHNVDGLVEGMVKLLDKRVENSTFSINNEAKKQFDILFKGVLENYEQ